MITQERLKELFHYDPETGELTRKLATSNRIKVGDSFGCEDHNGHIIGWVDGKLQKSHRMIWLYVYGELPKGEIDHINGVTSDNRVCNLRDVSRKDNQRNTSLRAGNRTGIPGVAWDNQRDKWRVRIHTKQVGRFGDFFEACCARKSAELKHGYHPNHGRAA